MSGLIFHIADAQAWAAATDVGRYTQSTRELTLEQVGFIHCSARAQLSATAQRFYADVTEPLVVLEIAPDRLRAAGIEVRWEHTDPSDAASPVFPHVYGPLPTDCVCRALPAAFDAQGEFGIPGLSRADDWPARTG